MADYLGDKAASIARRMKDMGDGTFAEVIASVPSATATGTAGYPASSGSTTAPLSASSGNVANAAAVATLAAAAAVTTYISGFEVTSGGATAASLVSITITGLIGGTATYTLGVVAGAAAANVPLVVCFNPPIPASAVNTAIVVTVPALGAGNTNSTVVAHGYRA